MRYPDLKLETLIGQTIWIKDFNIHAPYKVTKIELDKSGEFLFYCEGRAKDHMVSYRLICRSDMNWFLTENEILESGACSYKTSFCI